MSKISLPSIYFHAMVVNVMREPDWKKSSNKKGTNVHSEHHFPFKLNRKGGVHYHKLDSLPIPPQPFSRSVLLWKSTQSLEKGVFTRSQEKNCNIASSATVLALSKPLDEREIFIHYDGGKTHQRLREVFSGRIFSRRRNKKALKELRYTTHWWDGSIVEMDKL